MREVLVIFETLIAAVLVGLVLLQAKGTGLGASFGGGGEMYRSRRGVEKIVTVGTVVFTLLFGLVSLVLLFIS